MEVKYYFNYCPVLCISHCVHGCAYEPQWTDFYEGTVLQGIGDLRLERSRFSPITMVAISCNQAELFIKFRTTMPLIQFGLAIKLARWGSRWRVRCWFVFFFERVNTEENPFLFVTTPAINIPWLLPVYFDDVHDVPQRLTKLSCVDPSWFLMWGRHESSDFPMTL